MVVGGQVGHWRSVDQAMTGFSVGAAARGMPGNRNALRQPGTAAAGGRATAFVADRGLTDEAEYTHVGAVVAQGAVHGAGIRGNPVSFARMAWSTIGWSYWAGSSGFKPTPARGCGGLAYRMAWPTKECKYMYSWVRVSFGADQLALSVGGRARERDRTVVVSMPSDVVARECEQ